MPNEDPICAGGPIGSAASALDTFFTHPWPYDAGVTNLTITTLAALGALWVVRGFIKFVGDE